MECLQCWHVHELHGNVTVGMMTGGGGWREGGEHNGEPSIFSEDGSSLWHCQVRSTNEMKSFFLEIFIIMFDVIIQLQTLCESFLDN